ncbi:hypothetical protein B0F90DRAFT_1928341 [Multifurca ochricompacta]|uniref:Uncharacterized protein n=1 Tax=Multifurca ochricompacta TaxID=376703 RepID=A0AAD4LX53_9AGAM|nr:hypothetical protein B0F90DRAFT_1928341 [Multifurca ochricompacta]
MVGPPVIGLIESARARVIVIDELLEEPPGTSTASASDAFTGAHSVAENPSTPMHIPSLSLTATPRQLEPPTPDIMEDPLRALVRICAFLASNTARALGRDEPGVTPPLAGVEPYLDAVSVDLVRINKVVAKKRVEEDEEEEEEEGEDEQGNEAAVADSSRAWKDTVGDLDEVAGGADTDKREGPAVPKLRGYYRYIIATVCAGWK